MRADRLRPARLVVLALLCSLVALPGSGTASTAAADDLGCGTAQVTRTLSTGSAWRMCVRIHPFKGLVLTDVQFRPASGDREYAGWMPVIDSLYLAQLNVPYDIGGVAYNDITSYGFGDDHLLPQTAKTCTGDTMAVEQSFLRGSQLVERTVPGVCVGEVETGLGWHSQPAHLNDGNEYAQQGRALEVSSLSKISWYEYQQTVTLTDQGTITVGLGATGDLAPNSAFFPADPSLGWPIGPDTEEPQHGASHWHNATYRVDFGIDTGPQRVEQWDYQQPDPDNPTLLRGARTVRGNAFTVEDPERTSWWRVVNPTSLNPDGHPRSYEIVDDSMKDPYLPLTRPSLSFTNDHACQEYASMNLNADCPGQSVADYVAEETEPLTDPVAWVNVGFHHVVRDEDQSPMPVHWQSFSLVPRDLLAQQATTPADLGCENGLATGGSEACKAVNLTPPAITASATPAVPGTVLSADTGTWRHSRAQLRYQQFWLRDGHPIITTGPDGLPTATSGEHYLVTGDDVGHQISVRVGAYAAGVTGGSATSTPVTVVAGPPGGQPSATSTPGADPTSPRTRPVVRLRVVGGAHHRPRLRVVVRGTHGQATGQVTIKVKPKVKHQRGGTLTRRLERGRSTVSLPRPRGSRYLVVVRYLGSKTYLTAAGRAWVRPRT